MFQYVALPDTTAEYAVMDSAKQLVLDNANTFIASQNRPADKVIDTGAKPFADLPDTKWAKIDRTGYAATGAELADRVHGFLNPAPGTPVPGKVMVDELSGTTIQKIYDFAVRMGSTYSGDVGKWGVFLSASPGVSFDTLNPQATPAIDAVLDAAGTIACEFYYRQRETRPEHAGTGYCQRGTTPTARDTWLGDNMRGERGASLGLKRFHWLAQRKVSRTPPSGSVLTVMFGVTDKNAPNDNPPPPPPYIDYLNGTDTAVFLDRLFLVWVTRSGYRSFLLAANGGAGAYKWDAATVSNTSRDLAFLQAWNRYCRDGLITTLKPEVTCPA